MPDVLVLYVLPPAMIVVGALVLMWSADRLVEHAAWIAHSFRVPHSVVGAVVLGFGTSLPELLVSVSAILDPRAESAAALGNVVGSNIANVGLILGCAAVLVPFTVPRYLLRFDLPLALVGALVMALLVGPLGSFTPVMGAFFLLVFVVFLVVSVQRARVHRRSSDRPELADRSRAREIGWVVVALAGVALGARVFVWGATQTAQQLGIDQEVIALSIFALGTSLPEFATVYASARKGHSELAVGNVAGSNIFNLFLVLPICSFLTEIPFSARMAGEDFPVLVLFAAAAFPLLAWRARRVTRLHGWCLLAMYVGYMAFMFTQGRVR